MRKILMPPRGAKLWAGGILANWRAPSPATFTTPCLVDAMVIGGCAVCQLQEDFHAVWQREEFRSGGRFAGGN
jgi:hypothetical protein